MITCQYLCLIHLNQLITMAKLKFCSYNSTGFNFQTVNFINFLLINLDIDFFMAQEHFILRDNSHLVSNEFLSYNVHFTPATKNNSVINRGRPSGGLFILWKKTLNNKVNVLQIKDNSRIQAIEIDKKIILCNCYFPCDTQDLNFNNWELQSCLNDLNEISNLYPNHSIIMGGDLNCSFDRNTPFVNLIRDWIMERHFHSVWWGNPIDFTYSKLVNNRVQFSLIDHFIINNIASTAVSETGVLHLGENFSNHDPIYLYVDISLEHHPENNDSLPYVYNPNWRKADENQVKDFKNDLTNNACLID